MFKATRDVILRAEDWTAALSFYESVLGLTVSARHPGIIGFEAGGFQLFVEQGPAHGPVFEFLVADVAATKARLLAAGCTLIEEDPVRPRCYLRDPFGLTFNLGRSA
jgi:catechol 2,3-dioxygenase-like lactoylglutathione lyase family enzyme